jgi:lysozyme family protein
MAEFAKAIEKTLGLEGWGKFVNDKFDPGGQTRWGISAKSYPEENIAALSYERALELYRRDFWHPLYDLVNSQEVAEELFDFGVNTSARGWPKIAVQIFQEAVRYLVAGPVIIDGRFGSKTLELTNSVDSRRLLKEFRARQAYYYAEIVIRQPDVDEQLKNRFLLGWFRRVME